ncbi:interleukin-9 receptor [Danio aesculapii]|uniref:interleukin-9 receptor n=1 Tax=Danio aesculapii TaxID=1142201 RepID=UPI0024C0BE20|nr:interleukin-9 receptor [Danio aesculapii]
MHRSPIIFTLVCFSDFLAFITLGDQYSLQCLSNYLSNISCSLNISDEFLGNESSYWLNFSVDDEQHICFLQKREQALLCELDLSPDVIFSDVDTYRISFHSAYHDVILDEEFMPSNHIRPVPPSDLSVLWVKNSAVFQWQSGYEAFSWIRSLFISHLQYQLSMSSTHKVYEAESAEQKVYVDESKFEPHTDYTVRVRSQPDQGEYKGVWSPWAPAILWRSGDIHKESTERSFHIAWYLLFLPLLLVLLSCIPYSRWMKDDYVPSPAPYFRDWEVDVQMCSAMSGKMCDVMQGEESLKIDRLTECTATPLQQTVLDYEKMGVIDRQDATPPSPSMPHSPVGSEVDSGCWIRDFVPTEGGSITCSEDYCTLSSIHTYSI